MVLRSALLAIVALLLGGGHARADGEAGKTWFIITAQNGDPIGHASNQVVQGGDRREVIDEQALYVTEEGSSTLRITSRIVRKEDRQGRTVSITRESETGGNRMRKEAQIGSGRAVVREEGPSGRRTTIIPLPASVRNDGGDGLLADWDPTATPRLEFERFDLDSMTVERVVLEALPSQSATREVVRRRYEGDDLRGVSRLTLDADRRVIEVRQPMFGTSITIRPADRETALKPHAPYRILSGMLAKSPFRIPPAATQGHIRYRFAVLDGFDFPLPQTGEQKSAAVAGQVTVDICRGCGPGLPSDPGTLRDALRPTAWMQTEDSRIRRIARPVARQRVSEARKMEMLAERARPYLERMDFTGHYSAAEALSRRAGDCTEAAVLLAALGRAAGIPTRVASGLVYSRESYHGVSHAFMPHSWVVAYVDGAWRSYDAALSDFDSTHIALTIGDGDPRSITAAGQLASLLTLEAMGEVRTEPAT